MADTPQVFPLKCSVQKYAWGKLGEDSAVAQLSQNANPDFQIEDEQPYAELWMGTHPNGPSTLLQNGTEVSLKDWIEKNPDKLGGEEIQSYFKGQLPFLFKVLSVRTSLSIQAHPHKVFAAELHQKNPEMYKDDNHKPEMAIALTSFEGLCGFRPIKEIAGFLEDIEEFRTAVGGQNAIKVITASKCMDMPLQRQALKTCFNGLMNQDAEVIAEELTRLVDKVRGHAIEGDDIKPYVGEVLLKLHDEFPGDRGGFAIYFLNVITLEPGEAMFLEANLPHAYLSGDCMECMACSDNVVRAGLTVKFVDVHTLCEMLDYTSRPVSRTKFRGIQRSENGVTVTDFKPPVADFSVTRYQVGKDATSCVLPALKSASISIVIEGSGSASNCTLKSPLALQEGTVFFTSAGEEVNINVTSKGMLLFRAYAGL